MEKIRAVDPEISALLEDERRRLDMCIDLIAPENFALGAILEAQGSITNRLLIRICG